MKQPDLKKCPFCGGDAEITYGAYDENWWGVRCETCGALVSMPDFDMHDAIEAWNARVGTRIDDFDFSIARRGSRPEARIISAQVSRLSCMLGDPRLTVRQELEVCRLIASLVTHDAGCGRVICRNDYETMKKILVRMEHMILQPEDMSFYAETFEKVLHTWWEVD